MIELFRNWIRNGRAHKAQGILYVSSVLQNKGGVRGSGERHSKWDQIRQPNGQRLKLNL